VARTAEPATRRYVRRRPRLSLGCGWLLEALSGDRLPGPLLVPAGLALVILVATFTTLDDTTAPATMPAVVTLAIVGALLRLRRGPKRVRVDWWATAAAVVAFLAYGAPVLASGAATFAGFHLLDDTAVWFAMTDRIMDHGRDLSNLAPSAYENTLRAYTNPDPSALSVEKLNPLADR